MNILHVRSSEFLGGPEKAIVGQCRAMTKHRGMCASFVRAGRVNEFLESCSAMSIPALSLPQRRVFDVRPVQHLRRAVAQHHIDIVVSHDYKSNLFGALALRGLPVAQIAHFRGRTAEDVKVRFYNLLDRHVLRRMKRVFVVCRAAMEELVRQGIDARSIRVVPNGYDCSVPFFSADKAQPGAAHGPVRILAAGRLSKEKGFDLLVAAAALLRRSGYDFHIDIYGEGPEFRRLQNQIRETRLDEEVSLLGFTHDLAGRMREASMLVIPSRSEGMPNVLLEAWAQGLTVVATPVGGIPEMIDHPINGLLADRVSPESLSAAMGRALGDPAGLIARGLSGQAKLLSHFSFEKQAQLLEALYDEVCGSLPVRRNAQTGPG